MMGIIIWLVVGGIIGWIASLLMRTDGQQGIFLNIVVGIVGAFIGGWLAGVLHIHVGTGWISAIITGFCGAALLLIILRAVRRGA